jgi:myo-inositol 2-dehydrogenase / D-chiro-inositol 1-dehydrogenase
MDRHSPKDYQTSRRSFMNGMMPTAIAGVAAGAMLESSLRSAVYAAGDETVKVALVGCGSRGTGAASQALQTKGPIKLWAMADIFADRLEYSLENLTKGEKADYDREAHQGLQSQIDVPPERRFVGFDAYQKAISSGVDLVILATPAQFRSMQYAYAVEQGKHVFMEKPLAVDAPGIRQILKANEDAKRKNLKVGVGLMLRHNRGYQELVQRIQDGAIGPIAFSRCYWNTGSLRDTQPRPQDMTEMMYQLRNPYHFQWLSGDYFVDALLHYLDLAFWAKGDHPINAQGQGGRIVWSDTQCGDIYDHHFVEFTYGDESKLFAQERVIGGCWGLADTVLQGLNGSASFSRIAIEGDKAWKFRGKLQNPYQIEHDVLMESIRRDQPHNDVDTAATSTMAAIMGRMASYSGKVVDWETAFNSTLRLGPENCGFDIPAPVVADAKGRYPIPIPGVTKAF